MNSDWRCRLRGDPANWLLDVEDNPSIYFWLWCFQSRRFVRALLYFNRHDDPRLARVIEPIAEDAARGNISALWALAEVSRERRPLQAEDSVACGAQVVLDMLARGDYSTCLPFSVSH
jgi:hypothetical protein